jgi:type IV pilus assembly protein PilM
MIGPFSRSLLALDIGTSGIKLMELSGGRQKKVRIMAEATLPAGTVENGLIKDAGAASGQLKELLKANKILPFGRRVCVNVSGNAVILKRVALAPDKDKELAEQAYYAAEQHFQHSMNDLEFDFCNIGSLNERGEMNVILVGAKREAIDGLIEVVHGCNMKIGVVETDVFALANMFEYTYGISETVMALINIGASSTQVTLVWRGEYLYTREIATGGEEYTRRISEAAGVDKAASETLKIGVSEFTQDPTESISKVISETNDQLVSEVQTTIGYYLQGSDNAVPGVPFTNAFLSGGGCRVLGLETAMASALQVPVQIMNPFQNVTVNQRKFPLDEVSAKAARYGVSVGLGLRSLGDKA